MSANDLFEDTRALVLSVAMLAQQVKALESAAEPHGQKLGFIGGRSSIKDAMAIKTAIRRAFPYLPVSIVAQEAAAADEQTPDYSSVLSPVVPTVEQEPAEEVEEAPAGVDPETGEIMAEIVSDEPELADEDIAFPGEE